MNDGDFAYRQLSLQLAKRTFSNLFDKCGPFQVDGELRPGLTAMDAFRASFPAGTLTGAPKVRAMEIIDEMEPERRGWLGRSC